MTNEELKPCPFCGNTDIEKIDIIEGVEMACYCNAFLELKPTDNRQEAIQAWNVRETFEFRERIINTGGVSDGC